ncbi:hypothetical protein [Rossellomorea aquimaris]|uniref:hypothetical protein n=1 Tax=Rossellomorea aquimaris TaxID=189382 RepID=UPI000A485DB0|nr:hypothetical protein [Rossellomorea aquimaris]
MEIYDWSRLVFSTFIISLLVISIVLLVQRNWNSMVNGFTITLFSCISIIISGINFIIIGYIADELNMAGDIASFYMFLVVLGLSILNLFIYFKKKKDSVE